MGMPTAQLTDLASVNPATGDVIGTVRLQSRDDYEQAVVRAEAVQASWRRLPAPRRGEVVRLIANAMRARIETLGDLVTR